MSIAHEIDEKIRTDDVQISESIEFSGLLLSQPILEGLTKAGFKKPSPIQLKAIPLGRCGLDLIVQAKSGTGKTCVFSVIALEGLNIGIDATQVLILAPTREIAIQISDVVSTIGSCVSGLKSCSFIGGTCLAQDKIQIKHCHIATGTPGRIKQLIEMGVLKTESIRLFVMDEADKLLDGSFTKAINWIYSSLPNNKQILALSATYPEILAQHLTRYMRNPTFVRLNITDPALIGIKQYHAIVPDHPLPNKVFDAKTEIVVKILSSVSFQQCLIFSNLQTRAQNLQSELELRNWPTECIAGCLDQKDRSLAMEQLKTYRCRILISTDLTSRGIDADKVNMVINLDVPKDHETYLHRIGRAGRFGSYGAAISIVSRGKQEKELWAVEKKCKTNIPKLPDPIPSDLATSSVALRLSDFVTTETIITHADLSMNPLPASENGDTESESVNTRSYGNAQGEEKSSNFIDEDKGTVINDGVLKDTNRNQSAGEVDRSENQDEINRNLIKKEKTWAGNQLTFSEMSKIKRSEEIRYISEINPGLKNHEPNIDTVNWCSRDATSKTLEGYGNVELGLSNKRKKSNNHDEETKGEGGKDINVVMAGHDDGWSVILQDNFCVTEDERGEKGYLKNVKVGCVPSNCCNENSQLECNLGEVTLDMKCEKDGVDGELCHVYSITDEAFMNEAKVLSQMVDSSNKESCYSGATNTKTTDQNSRIVGQMDMKIHKTANDNGADNADRFHMKYEHRRNKGKTDVVSGQQKHPRSFEISNFLKRLNEPITQESSHYCLKKGSTGTVVQQSESYVEEPKKSFSHGEKSPVPDCDWSVRCDKEKDMPLAMNSETSHFQEKERELSLLVLNSTDEGEPIVTSDQGHVKFPCDKSVTPFKVTDRKGEHIEGNIFYTSIKQSQGMEKQVMKSEEKSHLIDVDSPCKPSLFDKEQCKESDDCDKINCILTKNYSLLSLKDKIAFKTFSELVQDYTKSYQDLCKMTPPDVLNSAIKTLSHTSVSSPDNAVLQTLESQGFMKLMDTKRVIKKMIGKARLERTENPEIVKDFQLTEMRSCKINGQLKETKGRTKSNGRRVNRRESDSAKCIAMSYTKDNSDSDFDWRSKKGEKGVDKRNEQLTKCNGKKNFDVLLKEQLEMKRKIREKNMILQENDNKFCKKPSREENFDASLNEGRDTNKCISSATAVIGVTGAISNNEPNAVGLFPTNESHSSMTPEEECEMLDRMHLEMMMKRKNRKEKLATSKNQLPMNGSMQERSVISSHKPETNLSVADTLETTSTSGKIVPQNSRKFGLSRSDGQVVSSKIEFGTGIADNKSRGQRAALDSENGYKKDFDRSLQKLVNGNVCVHQSKVMIIDNNTKGHGPHQVEVEKEVTQIDQVTESYCKGGRDHNISDVTGKDLTSDSDFSLSSILDSSVDDKCDRWEASRTARKCLFVNQSENSRLKPVNVESERTKCKWKPLKTKHIHGKSGSEITVREYHEFNNSRKESKILQEKIKSTPSSHMSSLCQKHGEEKQRRLRDGIHHSKLLDRKTGSKTDHTISKLLNGKMNTDMTNTPFPVKFWPYWSSQFHSHHPTWASNSSCPHVASRHHQNNHPFQNLPHSSNLHSHDYPPTFSSMTWWPYHHMPVACQVPHLYWTGHSVYEQSVGLIRATHQMEYIRQMTCVIEGMVQLWNKYRADSEVE